MCIRDRVTLNDMLVDMPQDTLRLVANGTRISLGANPNLPEQDTLIAAGTQVVYLEVQADTMHVNLKDQMAVAVSGAELKKMCIRDRLVYYLRDPLYKV